MESSEESFVVAITSSEICRLSFSRCRTLPSMGSPAISRITLPGRRVLPIRACTMATILILDPVSFSFEEGTCNPDYRFPDKGAVSTAELVNRQIAGGKTLNNPFSKEVHRGRGN